MLKRTLCVFFALLLLACSFANAATGGKVWQNCTVGLTEIAVGDVIKGNVVVVNDTGRDLSGDNFFCVNYGNDGLLNLGYDSIGGWLESDEVLGKPILETINQYRNFSELNVINNDFYVEPPETADSTHIALWSVMLLLSAASVMMLLKLRSEGNV